MFRPLHERFISVPHAVFAPGRYIADNIILAYQIIHTMKKKKGNECFLGIKFEIAKAFDSLE